MRRRYLVGYDIADAKRLRLVYKAMKGWGYRLQYSFFVADLDRIERIRMEDDLAALINSNEDSIMIVDLGETHRRQAGEFAFLGIPVDLPDNESFIL